MGGEEWVGSGGNRWVAEVGDKGRKLGIREVDEWEGGGKKDERE